MSTLEQRLAALTDTTSKLIVELRELNRLRERVSKAELSARRSGGQPPKAAHSGTIPRIRIWLLLRTDRNPSATGERSTASAKGFPDRNCQISEYVRGSGYGRWFTPGGFLLLLQSSFARRWRPFADLKLRVVHMCQRLAKVAHVEPLPTARALHEVIGFGFGSAIDTSFTEDGHSSSRSSVYPGCRPPCRLALSAHRCRSGPQHRSV